MSKYAGNLELDTTFAFASSISSGVTVDLDMTAPAKVGENGYLLVIVKNPSANTDLTIKVQNLEKFDVLTPCLLTTLAVPASTSKSFVVQGSLLGLGARFTVSNDSALAGGQGFTGYLRVKTL